MIRAIRKQKSVRQYGEFLVRFWDPDAVGKVDILAIAELMGIFYPYTVSRSLLKPAQKN